ncbi:hypothetical protein [Pseudomonas amygdali]|uniref:hypothetical protein n=1 Tax=Pseudomonas amygdali TaxID=47877 RepID=UPI00070A7E9D|nr:hypothetical protein [Pseudomonas amygdali]
MIKTRNDLIWNGLVRQIRLGVLQLVIELIQELREQGRRQALGHREKHGTNPDDLALLLVELGNQLIKFFSHVRSP